MRSWWVWLWKQHGASKYKEKHFRSYRFGSSAQVNRTKQHQAKKILNQLELSPLKRIHLFNQTQDEVLRLSCYCCVGRPCWPSSCLWQAGWILHPRRIEQVRMQRRPYRTCLSGENTFSHCSWLFCFGGTVVKHHMLTSTTDGVSGTVWISWDSS
jgi:hypothetical protein